MADIETRLRNLATRTATESKSLRTLINANLSSLASLTTTAKGNIVAAINELVTAIATKQNSLGFTPIDVATKGQPSGVASLDGTGKVPAAQLPGFVDDVLEVGNVAALPATGASGVIYLTVDSVPAKEWRWTGTQYQELVSSPGTTDAVAEGAVNLYFTSARAIAALTPSLGNTDADLVAEFEAGLI
jgi:hypothetical protein